MVREVVVVHMSLVIEGSVATLNFVEHLPDFLVEVWLWVHIASWAEQMWIMSVRNQSCGNRDIARSWCPEVLIERMAVKLLNHRGELMLAFSGELAECLEGVFSSLRVTYERQTEVGFFWGGCCWSAHGARCG